MSEKYRYHLIQERKTIILYLSVWWGNATFSFHRGSVQGTAIRGWTSRENETVLKVKDKKHSITLQ